MKHIFLQPLRLKGGITLPHRIMPGPMEGVMNPLFCRTINELELLDYWITPFIRLTNALPKMRSLKNKLKLYDIENKPVILQFLGNNPTIFADVAKRVHELGVAGINLNFACPAKQVLSKNGGGKLLTDPQLMIDIVNAVCEASPDISVSVKLRTGYTSTDEMEFFLPKLVKCNIDFIMIHSRTVKEMYNEITDGPLRISQAVKLASPLPVIASGDIFSVDDAKKMFEKGSCAGITVARGLLRDPFLIRRLKADLNCEIINKTNPPELSPVITDEERLLKDDSRVVFFKQMCEIIRKEAKYYKRSSFLEIARFMWGKNSRKFKMLIELTDQLHSTEISGLDFCAKNT